MYTPHVPNSLKAAYRVPEPVPRTETNCEPCDYDLVHGAAFWILMGKSLLIRDRKLVYSGDL